MKTNSCASLLQRRGKALSHSGGFRRWSSVLLFGVLISSFIFAAGVDGQIVSNAPTIIVQPQSQAVWGGTTVTLSVSATGGGNAGTLPAINSGTLQLWLQADADVTSDTSGLVSRWKDQSGNGNDSVQTNLSQQPLLVHPLEIGTKPAVRFNGIPDSPQSEFLYGSGSVAATSAMTTFMFYEESTSTSAEEVAFYIGVPGISGDGWGDYLASQEMALSEWSADYIATFTVPTNTYRIWSDRLDTNQTLVEMFDDTLESSTNFDIPTSQHSSPGPGYYIGGLDPSVPNVGSSGNFPGDIAELLIYSGALTDPDRVAVVNYLKQKYYQVNGPGLTFQWQFNGTNLAGATNATLTLPDIQTPAAGTYTVVASNVYGTLISSNAVVAVKEIPIILTQPANQTVPAYKPLTLSVSAEGPNPLPYQWAFDGTNIADATNSTLVLTNPVPSQSGTYSVILGIEPNITASSNAAVLIQILPKIVIQPESLAVISGTNATFSVVADGTAVTYQWLRNNLPLLGQTNSSINVTDVGTNNTGLYTVTISNDVGAAIGSAYLDLITGPPSILVQPGDHSAWGGTPVTLAVSASAPGGGQWGILPEIGSGTLQLWLRADAGVTSDASGLVSRWQDQSGNENDSAQTNLAQQPLLVHPTDIGSLPAIRFNGVQDSAQSEFLYGPGAVGTPNAMTSFMVYEANTITSAEEVAFYIGVPGRNGGWGDYLASQQMALSTWNAAYITSFPVPTNTYRIWTDRLDTNQTLLEMFDDSLQSSTNFDLPTISRFSPDPGYYIGGLDPSVQYVGASRNLAGDIAELLIYSGALPDTDRLTIVNYLKQKYYQVNGAGLTFQWQFNGTNLLDATSGTLTLPDHYHPVKTG